MTLTRPFKSDADRLLKEEREFYDISKLMTMN
jgi:hypothetical protein